MKKLPQRNYEDENTLFINLIDTLKKQNRSQDEINAIKKAYYFARNAHQDQVRKSGNPFIIHPLNVAITLINLNADQDTICAGLLHDVIEDTGISAEEIKNKFGKEVCSLVEGVTNLSRLKFVSKKEHQAENFRKFFLSIASDLRVVLIKLSDRLHNMHTLKHLPELKRQKIASETLEIFAPLANRFGLGYFKWRLEDLSFKYLEPEAYRRIEKMVKENRSNREAYLQTLTELIGEEIRDIYSNAQISGRVKHFYSIYGKIKRLKTEEIFDLLALRIIVEKERQCYEVLGVIHDLFQPIPGRFKDYIAIPKSNMYRSLHTTVIGPDKKLVEIQIRTLEMHNIAEYGIAAHWKYKEKGESVTSQGSYDLKLSGLRKKLIEMQEELPDAAEYNKAVKIDIFADEIFIFSPKGDVYCLPRGSTPIDFAYYVHSEIGNKCIGAKVNERLLPLSYILRNGDIVEIQTSKNAHPSLDWLTFVKSGSAKTKIKQWFRKNRRSDYIQKGYDDLQESLDKAQLDEILKKDIFKELLEIFHAPSEEEFFFKIGIGEIASRQVIGRLKQKKLIEEKKAETEEELLESRIAKNKKAQGEVQELKDLMHSFAKCCQPIPGEEIIGAISRTKGIVVHRKDCPNVQKVEAERLLKISWGETIPTNQLFIKTIQIECVDRIGISRDILDKIANQKVNLLNIKILKAQLKDLAIMRITLQIKNLKELNSLINSISMLSDIIQIRRI